MIVGRFTPRQLRYRSTTALPKNVPHHRTASTSTPVGHSSRGPPSFATPPGALAQQNDHGRVHQWTILTSCIRRAASHRIAIPQQRAGYHQPGFHFPALAHAPLNQRPAWFPKWKPISHAPTPSAAMDVDVAADLWGPQCPIPFSEWSAVADHGPVFPSLGHAPHMEVDAIDAHNPGVASSMPAILRSRMSLPRARYRPYPAHRPPPTKRRGGETLFPSLDHAPHMDVETIDAHTPGVTSSTLAILRPRRSLPRTRYRPYPAHRPPPTKRRVFPSLDHAPRMEVETIGAHTPGVTSSTPTILRPRGSLPRMWYRPYPAHRPPPTKRRRGNRSRPFPVGNTDTPPAVALDPTPTPAELWREPAGEFLDDEDNDEADVPEVSLEPRLGDSDVRNIIGGMYLMSLYPSPPIVVRPIIQTWLVTELGKKNSLHYGVDVRSRIVQGPLDRPDGMPVYVEDPVRQTPIFSVGGGGWGIPVSSLPRSPPQPAVPDEVPIKESVPVNPPLKPSSRTRSGHRGKEAQQNPPGEAVVEGLVSQQHSRRVRRGKENRKPPQEDLGAAVGKKVPRVGFGFGEGCSHSGR